MISYGWRQEGQLASRNYQVARTTLHTWQLFFVYLVCCPVSCFIRTAERNIQKMLSLITVDAMRDDSFQTYSNVFSHMFLLLFMLIIILILCRLQRNVMRVLETWRIVNC